jgi:predicted transposase YdaD
VDRTHHGDAILRLGGVTGFTRWKPLQSEVVAPRRLPDGLLEVRFPNEPEPTLVLVEIETYPDNSADAQVLDDLMLIAVDRGVVPDVVSLVLKPKGNLAVTGQAERQSRHGGAVLSGAWRVVRLWELDAEDLFAAGDVGLIPWVPLTRTTQPPEQLLARCRDRLAAVPDANDRAGLMVVAQILAGLAYPDRRVLDLFGGPEVMIESPVLDEVKEILRKRYEEQYKTEGRAEAFRQLTVEGLVERFGAVPEELQSKLTAITDLPRLKSLVRLAATCPDLAAFVAQV